MTCWARRGLRGRSRDGTWRIENGKVTRPVKNMRFTQSIIEALSNTDLVGRDAEIAGEFFFAASRVPALVVRGFNFSSASDH